MNQSLPSKSLDWNQIWERNKSGVILGLIGLVLISAGIFTFLIFHQNEASIEILPAEESPVVRETIFVDLEGAVEKPGLYELPSDSRVNDLLVQAGGLSAKADREWVERNLNLAQGLSDGVKIYIPSVGETAKGIEQSIGAVAGSSASLTGKININTASASELDSLWGIGEKRAEAIIKNRPYSLIEELKTKKIIPSNVYERVKDEISVY